MYRHAGSGGRCAGSTGVILHYFTLWKAFGALPERFLYGHGQLHLNQQQYALRPELMESTFYLYQVPHRSALEYCMIATYA